MKMQLHQYPGGHQVDGLPPVLSGLGVPLGFAWSRLFYSLRFFWWKKRFRNNSFWRVRANLDFSKVEIKISCSNQVSIVKKVKIMLQWELTKYFCIAPFSRFFFPNTGCQNNNFGNNISSCDVFFSCLEHYKIIKMMEYSHD